MNRRRQAAGTPALCAHTAAVLLAGWGAEPPPDAPSAPDGVGDSFLELYAIGRIAALWRAHEGWLRARAAEWDWAPKYMHNGQPMFYGERAAAGGEEG